jgi:hypothetical protein
MHNLLAGFFIALCLFSFSDAAAAQDTSQWKKVGTWYIMIDKTLGNACFMLGIYEGGTILRIGFRQGKSQKSVPYMIVADEDWNSIEVGKDYDLRFKFDNEAPWNVPARGLAFNKAKVLYFDVTDWDFIDELMRKHRVLIEYNGKTIAILKLDGSFAALKETANCHARMAEVGTDTWRRDGDPFSSSPNRTDADPFD